MNLDALLRPRSIAVIGGSLDAATWGGRVTRSLRRLAPSREIAVVNRRVQDLPGITCVTSIADLPHGVDQVLIAAPAAAVPELLRQAATVGIPTAVVFSSNFGESKAPDAARLERELRCAIAETEMTVLGPNCLGYNTVLDTGEILAATSTTVLDVVDPDQLPVRPAPIALVTQSGGVGAITQGHLLQMDVWPAAVVHTGNEYGVSIDDVVRRLCRDRSIEVVGVYVEGIRDAEAFAGYACDLQREGKRMVALVGGRSDAGGRAVQSHSGRLVADGHTVAEFVSRLGVPLARDMHQFAQALASSPGNAGPIGSRLGIITASGGFGTLAADVFADHGYAVPELTTSTQEQLSAVLPEFAAVRNPVDVTGQVFRDPSSLCAALCAVARDPNVDAVVITLGSMERFAETIVNGIVAAREAERLESVFVSWPLAPSWVFERLRAAGITAVASSTELAALLDLRREVSDPRGGSSTPGFDASDSVIELRRGQDAGLGADEAHAKSVLAELGLPSPRRALVTTRAEAVDAAVGMDVAVLKGRGAALVHKADLQLVELDLDAAAAVGEAFDRIAARLTALGQPVEVLVEEQFDARRELLLGWTRTAFGTSVIFGTGGAGAEQIDDVASRLLPLGSDDALELLRSTVAGRSLLAQQPSSATVVVDALVRLAALADASSDVAVDLDVNPLAISSDGAMAVLDACFAPSPVLTAAGQPG